MLTELIIASHNTGKVREIADLLAPLGISVQSAGELNLPEPEETGLTFVENARIKSLAAALSSGKPALADDSGLAVAALNGAPGIYSARWAGAAKDFSLAMRRIQDELTASGNNPHGAQAAFICALSLALPDGREESFEGRVDGTLTFPPRGQKGFGYDPIFIPHGHTVTFAEMEPQAKHRISHRADAFGKFLAHLKKRAA